MPARKPEIKIKVDYGEGTGEPEWIRIPFAPGVTRLFVINDPDQKEYYFAGFKFVDEKVSKYILSYLGEEIEVFPFEVSAERDSLKRLLEKDGDIEKD